MKRVEAIEIIITDQLKKMSDFERDDQLDVMCCEDWSFADNWSKLPRSVRKEFKKGELRYDPVSSRYDPVLLIWLADNFKAVTNEYILQKVRGLGEEVEEIDGEPVLLEACPCCGYRTIGSRSDLEIIN